MKRNLPKYICEYSDRHGKLRRYFRYKGKNTAVPYSPDHAEFDAYYEELLRNKSQGSTLKIYEASAFVSLFDIFLADEWPRAENL